MIKKVIVLLIITSLIGFSEQNNNQLCSMQEKKNQERECLENPPYPDGPWQDYKYASIKVERNVLCVSFSTLFGSTGLQCITFSCKDTICHNGEVGVGARIFRCRNYD